MSPGFDHDNPSIRNLEAETLKKYRIRSLMPVADDDHNHSLRTIEL